MVIIIQSVAVAFPDDIILIIFTKDLYFFKYGISLVDIVNSLESSGLAYCIRIILFRSDKDLSLAEILPADAHFLFGRIIDVYSTEHGIPVFLPYNHSV